MVAESTQRRGAGEGVWLGIETATSSGSVALWRGAVIFEATLNIQGGGSETLLPVVDAALEMSGIGPEEIDSLVVGAGPGSFTGVRIGASLAKGWVAARGTSLYAYSSLLAAAAGLGAAEAVCPLFDARREEVYAACYRLGDEEVEEILPPSAWPLRALLAELDQQGVTPVFVGEGAVLHRPILREVMPRARMLPGHIGRPRASSLLWLRSRFPDLGRVADPESWEPIYVREWRAR